MNASEVKELMSDAEACLSLSEWEEDFCDSMRTKLQTYGDDLWLSDKQIEVLQRIEEKVYAS